MMDAEYCPSPFSIHSLPLLRSSSMLLLRWWFVLDVVMAWWLAFGFAVVGVAGGLAALLLDFLEGGVTAVDAAADWGLRNPKSLSDDSELLSSP